MAWGAAILGLVSSIATSIIANEQQKNNQERQEESNRRLQKENQELAVKTWKETNASAQVGQLRSAGLSTGLMYKNGGPGGQTSSQPASVGPGETTFRNPGAEAMNFALGLERQKAEIENINADTKLKLEDAGTPTAGRENTIADTVKKGQETANAKLQGEILKIEAHIKNMTQEDILKQVAAESDKAVGEAISSRAKGEIDEQTYNDRIAMIKQEKAEQQLRMAAQKSNINLQQSQVVKIANEINMAQQNNMREWDKMSQTDREIQIKKLLSSAQIDLMGAQEIKAMTSIITDMISGAHSVPASQRKIGF